MRRRMILKGLFSLLVIFCIMSVPVYADPGGEHSHSLTHFDYVQATSENTGTVEYWYCDTCGKYYRNSNATYEVSQEELTIEINHLAGTCGTNHTVFWDYDKEHEALLIFGKGNIPNGWFSTSKEVAKGSLTISEGITGISSDAFSFCSGLTGDLTIPGGVTSIGNYAFAGCSGLTGRLTIPQSVIVIGESAFDGLYNVSVIDNKSSCSFPASDLIHGTGQYFVGSNNEKITYSNTFVTGIYVRVSPQSNNIIKTSVETDVNTAADAPTIMISNLNEELAVRLLTEQEQLMYNSGIKQFVYMNIDSLSNDQVPVEDMK